MLDQDLGKAAITAETAPRTSFNLNLHEGSPMHRLEAQLRAERYPSTGPSKTHRFPEPAHTTP